MLEFIFQWNVTILLVTVLPCMQAMTQSEVHVLDAGCTVHSGYKYLQNKESKKEQNSDEPTH